MNFEYRSPKMMGGTAIIVVVLLLIIYFYYVKPSSSQGFLPKSNSIPLFGVFARQGPVSSYTGNNGVSR